MRSSKENIAAVSGHVDGRVTRSYRLRITASQVVTFAVDADNTACGSEIKKTSQLGLLTVMDRFLRHSPTLPSSEMITPYRFSKAGLAGCTMKFASSLSLRPNAKLDWDEGGSEIKGFGMTGAITRGEMSDEPAHVSLYR